MTSWAARLLSGAVLLLAVAGVWRQPVLRYRAMPLLVITAAPLPMFVASSYGSEMIFRVLMFMLPGVAFFGAAALLPKVRTLAATEAAEAAAEDRRKGEARTRHGFGLRSGFGVRVWGPLPVLLAGTLAFVPSYSGKDRISYFPPQEVALVQRLFDEAPRARWSSPPTATTRSPTPRTGASTTTGSSRTTGGTSTRSCGTRPAPSPPTWPGGASRSGLLPVHPGPVGQLRDERATHRGPAGPYPGGRRRVAAVPAGGGDRRGSGLRAETDRGRRSRGRQSERRGRRSRGGGAMTPQDFVIRMLPPFGGWLALAALALPGGSPLRGAAVVVFLAAGPGAALVGLCGPALRIRTARGPVEQRAPTSPATPTCWND
ncbi:hypothetical protein ACR6C2_27355 [Streptomyces sp. INA 01156]